MCPCVPDRIGIKILEVLMELLNQHVYYLEVLAFNLPLLILEFSTFYSSSLRRADTMAFVFAKSNKPPVSIK